MLGASLTLAACARDRDATRAGGAATGAAIGCGVGLAVGGEAQHCMLGAAVGGAGGLVVGNEIARRKQGYADWETALDHQLREAEQTNRALAAYDARLWDELEARRRRLASLAAGVRSGRVSIERVRAEQREMRRALDEARAELAEARDELAAKRTLLAAAEARVADDDGGPRAAYRREVALMTRRVDDLARLIDAYAATGERGTVI